MYNRELLGKYPYFADQLSKYSLEHLLDPLTGLVTRKHMIGFAESMIAAGGPFTYGMLDLDNFKFINDTYGHPAGDAVLTEVARSLMAFLGEGGVAGRFGGDEFLFLVPGHVCYADRKAFCQQMYESHRVLRRNIALPGCEPMVTGTLGCAGFPEDAGDYEGLFALLDKALYRGKTKGRNCYIIYVEAKHKDIEIRNIAKPGTYAILRSMVRQFECVPGLMNQLRNVTPLLMEELRIQDLYYVGADQRMRSVRDPAMAEPVGELSVLLKDDLFATNDPETLRDKAPSFYDVLMRREVETLMVVRIGVEDRYYGYLICAEPRSRRIWQEDECTVMYMLSKLLAYQMRITGESLEDHWPE